MTSAKLPQAHNHLWRSNWVSGFRMARNYAIFIEVAHMSLGRDLLQRHIAKRAVLCMAIQIFTRLNLRPLNELNHAQVEWIFNELSWFWYLYLCVGIEWDCSIPHKSEIESSECLDIMAGRHWWQWHRPPMTEFSCSDNDSRAGLHIVIAHNRTESILSRYLSGLQMHIWSQNSNAIQLCLT